MKKLTQEQIWELRLNHEEEHLEAWRRDTHETLIKCLAEVKLPQRRYAELFYDACNSALTCAARAGDFRMNELETAPEADRVKWAKNLKWKDIVEEVMFQFQNDIIEAIQDMINPEGEIDLSEFTEEELEDDDFLEPDDEDDDERIYFLGLMRKLAVMYSIVLENERREKAKIETS